VPQLPRRLDEPLALMEGASTQSRSLARSLTHRAASDHNDAD
jgi:hypothetical protein